MAVMLQERRGEERKTSALRPRERRRAARLGLLLLALASGASACKKAKPPPPPPPTVRVVPVQTRTVDQTEDFLATLDGSTNAEIRPQVTGTIEAVDYQEGTFVPENALLFTVDRRPFIAAVEKAEGDYRNAVAQHAKARADVRRFTPLVEEHAMSRQELDNARAAAQITAANVQAARGVLDAAKLNLQWTAVRSPIHGLAGLARTRVGNLVNPNQVLTVVSDLDPIRASINISEREYLRYADQFNHASEPQYANQRLFELLLSDGSIYPHTTHRIIVDREVNPTTGTLLVQMLFANPNGLLRPGMFSKVRAYRGRVQALLVPEVAVSQLQGRFQVRVVDAQGTVEVRPLKVGSLIDHEYIVQSGLRAGERVIVAGEAPPGTRVNAQVQQPAPPQGQPIGGTGGQAPQGGP